MLARYGKIFAFVAVLVFSTLMLYEPPAERSPAERPLGASPSESPALASADNTQGDRGGPRQPNDAAAASDDSPKFVPFSELPEDALAELARLRTQYGYLSPSDGWRQDYGTYDADTLFQLAMNGDPQAEAMVATNLEFSVEARRQAAINSARLGRTYALSTFGSQPFVPMVSGEEVDKEAVIIGYAYILAARALGDPFVQYDSPSIAERLETLTEEETEVARRTSEKLICIIQQGAGC
ncbi:MAG: hypothetical protein AAF578_00770 [Pseudomonadota bacterium]